MGKGIVYCQDCGKVLREDAFDKGKAQTIEDRPYCSACRPLDVTPSRAVKRISSVRLPVVKGRPAPAPAPPKSSRRTLIVGGAVAGVALALLLVLLLTGGGGPPAPKPGASPEARADPTPAGLLELEKFEKGDASWEEVLLRCDRLKPSLKGTSWIGRLEAVERRALERKGRDRASSELVAFLRTIDERIRGDAGFARRVEIEDMFASAEKIAAGRIAEVQRPREEYRRKFAEAARSRAEPLLAAAKKYEADGRWAEAADVLEVYPAAFASSSPGQEVARRRDELRRKQAQADELARVFHEGETLKVLEKSGVVQEQDMKPFGGFSNNIHLWWRETKPGAVLRLEFQSRVAGPRKVGLGLTRAPDYGIVKLSVNGAVVAERLDLYAPKVALPPEETFDAVLKQGANELRVEIVGTNPAAKPAHHMFGLDTLRIQ